jgi:hypothetical protein
MGNSSKTSKEDLGLVLGRIQRELRTKRLIQGEIDILQDKPVPGIIPLNSNMWRNFRKRIGVDK